MKNFLAIYLGTPAALEKWKKMSEGERKKREASGIKAWTQWVETHKAAILDQGAPLGKTRRASAQGIADIRNAMTAYVMVQAESHEAAARMFESHPHFTIFPGEAVEIMECLPLPSSRG